MNNVIKVIGNDKYLISDDYKLSMKDGKELSGVILDNDNVTISLYGLVGKVKLEWLYIISLYVKELPIGYQDQIFNIQCQRIKKENTKLFRDDYIITFKEPVSVDTHKKEIYPFRLLARYPMYAINELGVLYNVKLGKYKKLPNIEKPKQYNRYVHYDLIDNYLSRYTKVPIHRLVALAWVNAPDNNYGDNPIVNHINGKKYIFHYTNLEWVDVLDNNKHAVRTNLRTDNIPVTLRNIDTDEIIKLPSLTEACNYVGRSRINTRSTRLTEQFLLTGKRGSFEVRVEGDDTPWYYKDKDFIITRNQKVLIEVTKEDGSKEYTGSLPEFLNKYFNGKKVGDSIPKAVKVFKKKYPNRSIQVIELDQYAKDTKYIAWNIITNKKIVTDNRKELSRLTGVSKSSVQKSIYSNGRYQYNGWRFNIEGEPWLDLIIPMNKNQNITLLNLTTNNKQSFNSIREVAKFLNVSKKTVTDAINKEITINNYLLLQ